MMKVFFFSSPPSSGMRQIVQPPPGCQEYQECVGDTRRQASTPEDMKLPCYFVQEGQWWSPDTSLSGHTVHDMLPFGTLTAASYQDETLSCSFTILEVFSCIVLQDIY